ncbi:MAG: anti-sigma factor [Pseudomonadales bacterium]|nr:anti-sigma factor [Pseudomonadales bacterium]
MLKCKDIAEQSSEFVDQQFSMKQKAAYFFHLLMCGQCRRYIQQFRLMIKQSKNLQQKPISDETAEKILQQVKKHNK